MRFFYSDPYFIWSANLEGLAIRFSNPREFSKAKSGKAGETGQLGLIRMQMLAESGEAEVRDLDAGIFIAAADAVRLDADTRDGFQLPPPWPGGMRLQTESTPQASNFSAQLGLVDPGVQVRWEWKLRGPILEVGRDSFLPTSAQYAALRAFQVWRDSAERDELTNLSLIATLREARQAGCHIDLEAYGALTVTNARELNVDARCEKISGDLILRPLIAGEFPPISADEIEERLGQMSGDSPRGIFRVGRTIVLLNRTQTLQARALVQRGRVPKSEVAVFQKDPALWMAEHVFPDIETEFSPRVTGIGLWKSSYAGSMWGDGEDWFDKKPQPERKSRDESGKKGTEGSEHPNPTSEEQDEAQPVVPLILDNDSDLRFGWRDSQMDEECADPNFARYARMPLKHQQAAVIWLLRHARRALRRRGNCGEVTGLGAGALLADDMGLGKTFSTLIFLREWLDLWRTTIGGEPPAVLIVAPLSLVENWRDEIIKSYGKEDQVFTRILLAHPDGELHVVQRRPGGRDKALPGEVLEYGLGFGDGTMRSLDLPGSCVLTTYQTLRDYRFSFAKAEWSAAILDEAQNIKNPNALQTIAAKSLKALFRLTLTGTPVENHLGDFWSILDTSEPGPLGSFAEFRQSWIVPMIRQPENMLEIGSRLRAHVGELMLRRMKESELIGLPKKRGNQLALPVEMTEEQTSAYDAILVSAQEGDLPTETNSAHQNRQLAALWHLRQVSLHPDLLSGGAIQTANSSRESRTILQRSCKLTWLLGLLDEIKLSGEKALIFCVQKKLQEALARHLALIYGVTVPVINGDTKATSRSGSKETRLGLIEQFSQTEGFGICILSPIAAGAGLNIVAANHVIHLERHWNPAKEDQATDRAYRIGQKRAVTVYLPVARHPNPERRSFDDVLHGLIERKRGLQGALGLVPSQSVTDSELFENVFASNSGPVSDKLLGLADVLKLPWRLFEAFIAVLYERSAERVILTPGGNDRGCDVVVLGWGTLRENILIQCKATSRDELNSEMAVREVEGARSYYENALGVSFGKRCLHTTARRLSKRTLHAAKICGVTVHDQSWISAEIAREKVYFTKVLAKEASRETVE
jgi:superfamily II DNA or RNA helicase